jgi:hypothetical protein
MIIIGFQVVLLMWVKMGWISSWGVTQNCCSRSMLEPRSKTIGHGSVAIIFIGQIKQPIYQR